MVTSMRMLAAAVIALLTVASVPAGAVVDVDPVPERSWTVNGRVYASTIIGDTVYVGGNFTAAVSPSGETVERRRLAAFDLRTGALVRGFEANANGAVRALVTNGSTIWVGGNFGWIGGERRLRLAAVNAGSGSVRSGFTPAADRNVFALDLRAGRLFVGGNFAHLAGAARNRAGAVDPQTGDIDEQFRPSANGILRPQLRRDATRVLASATTVPAARAERQQFHPAAGMPRCPS